jgi:hypothetical protein
LKVTHRKRELDRKRERELDRKRESRKKVERDTGREKVEKEYRSEGGLNGLS